MNTHDDVVSAAHKGMGSIRIEPLTTEHIPTFIEFMNLNHFDHAPEWSSCYCRFYYTDCSDEAWQDRTAEENRIEAIDAIAQKSMHGYLAFDGEKCIGWCNATDLEDLSRIREAVSTYTQNRKVGCTICYVIHNVYRGQGVASQILDKVIGDFKARGFDAMLALPVENAAAPDKRYRGPLSMYLRKGYREIDKEGQTHVLWLDL